jgi:hypothetical protein
MKCNLQYSPINSLPFQEILGLKPNDFLDKAKIASANIFPVDEVVTTNTNEKMFYPRKVLENILSLFEGVLVRIEHKNYSPIDNETAIVGRIKDKATIKQIGGREWIVVDFLLDKQSMVDFLSENPWGLSVGFSQMDIVEETGIHNGEEYNYIVKFIGEISELSVVNNPQIQGIHTAVFSKLNNSLDNINSNLTLIQKNFLSTMNSATKNFSSEAKEKKEFENNEDEDIKKEFENNEDEDIKKEFSEGSENEDTISRQEFNELKDSVYQLKSLMEDFSNNYSKGTYSMEESLKKTNQEFSETAKNILNKVDSLQKILSLKATKINVPEPSTTLGSVQFSDPFYKFT